MKKEDKKNKHIVDKFLVLAIVIVLVYAGFLTEFKGEDYSAGLTGNVAYYRGVPTDYIAYWKFENNMNDENGRHAGECLKDSCPELVPGQIGQAYEFNGGEYIEVDDTTLLDISQFLTVSLWIKTNNANEIIIDKMKYISSRSTNGYRVRVLESGEIIFEIGSDNRKYIQDSVPITDNQWHHIVGVYDGDYILLYKDGDLVDKNTDVPYIIGRNNNDLRIGAASGQLPSNYLKGRVDEVILYERALTFDEIKEIYEAQNLDSGCIDKDGDDYGVGDCLGLDCDDENSNINPGAEELCNNIDDNCNGEVDENKGDCTEGNCVNGECVGGCLDSDIDNYDNCEISDVGDDGFAVDCNDNDANINPSAKEISNGIDDNCDGVIDEGCEDTLPNDYIAYWRFDKAMTDLTGKHDGECSSSDDYCPESIDGKFGKAYKFDGINDYITVGDSFRLNPEDFISIGAWIKTDYLGHQIILDKMKFSGTSSKTGYRLQVTSGRKISFGIAENNNWKFVEDNVNINDNQWHYVMGIFDNTELLLYKDGSLIKTANSTISGIGTTEIDLRIGVASDSLNNFFNGEIDEVVIYNRALTLDEVKQIYDSQNSGDVVCERIEEASEESEKETGEYTETEEIPAGVIGPDSGEEIKKVGRDTLAMWTVIGLLLILIIVILLKKWPFERVKGKKKRKNAKR